MNERTRIAPSSFILHPSSFVLPRGRILRVARTPLVMGVLNVTPDSFSDGGAHFDPSKAVQAALQMDKDGAAIIDVGGESTRPGSGAVSADEEQNRVIPVVEQIRRRSDIAISIDTTKAVVAEKAIGAGADIINDVSALSRDPAMRALAARCKVPVILMHMRGDPRTMQQLATYDDVVDDVTRELHGFVQQALAAGIDAQQILIDPGIGFAKTAEHNLELLARVSELASIAPVVVGASRKAFIGHLTGQPAGQERMVGSLAAVAAAFHGRAAVVRVHDVRETVDFLKVLAAIAERERQ
jgi:dihydropteroate synthase